MPPCQEFNQSRGRLLRPGRIQPQEISSSGGFTLVELLMTVLLVGILSAIAVPTYANVQDKARNAAVQANCHAVQMAIEQYGVDTAGVYPADAVALYNRTITDKGYMPGGAFPPTPWGTQQEVGITWNTASESAQAGDIIGVGRALKPSLVNDYGAIAYSIAAGATATERYNLVGVGKRSGKSVIVLFVRNY